MTVAVGSKVQEFSALSNKGTITLSEYSGKYVVIYFYPKDNTPGCTTEAIGFRTLYPQFQAANAEVIGVSRDSVESHTKFECKFELPFPLISDSDSKICKQFGVIKQNSILKGTPLGITRSTFLISPEGILLQEWRSVKVADHAQEVLASIEKYSSL
jgi:peroxiredoxin Q/BCP